MMEVQVSTNAEGTGDSQLWGGYAESIIKDPEFYDALELHGVRNILEDEYAAAGKGYNATTEGTQCEVDDENPQFFSIYAHMYDGGVECIGDFETYHAAAAYGMEIATEYGWPLYTYSATNGKEETRNDESAIVQWTHFGMSTASFRELVGPNNVRDGVMKNWSLLTSEAKEAIKAKRIEVVAEGLKLAHEADQKDAVRSVEAAKVPALGVFDLTPESVKTPEGAAKVDAALKAWEETHANVANEAGAFILRHEDAIAKALSGEGYDSECVEDLKEVCELIRDRENKQEAFLRALAATAPAPQNWGFLMPSVDRREL
ncbi:hypothetical protein [Edaphobacter modestus]|uniref:Uncharacterized protein n=1 Tax=Edaphobacter modestus TaxID=388466 RepID=A0A4Q7XZT3_9BACT|nr:hypothetical protein [Edaphobacter modestus]RZU28955.1 hypothetical protein BDD14_6541 [Edaphobacter modestus]